MTARQAQSASSTASAADPQIAEAFRSLRSTVKFAAGARPIRTVLVVDVDRDVSSGVAAQLAMAFAEAGDPCVLIDTDARSAAGGETGLFDLLRDGSQIGSVVGSESAGRLVRIGPGRSGSPDALAGDAFSPTIERLTETHGTAILSAAPLPRFADALAIASRVDAVVMVVTAGGTRRPRAIEARDALDRVGARILGVVMVEPKKRWFR